MFNKKKEKKSKFYSLDGILEKDADYNIIFGERSNAKNVFGNGFESIKDNN